ncbi:MAG: FtsQ-type POTRA domain-containing protein [Salinibacterium sp.]|nr:FtsQ-type POTRA domain-containing protein [Salinibacterium sp.]
MSRGASRRATRPDAATRAELRRASRERRRFERAEVRRFTRRARNRRVGFAALGGLLVTLVGLVLVAVYSPILALRTITVDGTSRIDAAEVQAAVDGQLGVPLALLNFDTITTDLTVFPLIRSYVTEIIPPDTLLIHISERAPVGSVKVGEMFNLVDPAGIVLQQSAQRIPGVPVLNVPNGDMSGEAFTSTVAVLLALPPEMLAQVDSVSASTQDDVSLVLTGVGQGVTWGSADNSARKANLLAALIRLTDPAQPGVFDVSAPGNGVFRPS